MIQISEPDSIVKSLMGKNNCGGSQRKLSQYVLVKFYSSVVLLYNTLTCEMVSLSINEWENKEDNKTLIEHFFVVGNDLDEFKFARKIKRLRQMVYRAEGKRVMRAPIERFWILTTTDCNARCFYCHEKGIPNMIMNEETSDRIVNYILKQRTDNIRIMWYGGEPLMGMNIISRICKNLKDNGITFSSGMISNGYLFDEKSSYVAKTVWNLTDVQITLDGLEDNYNKVKNYVYQNQSSPFLRVLRNIHSLIENGIQVRVRLNLDLYNQGDIEKLVDYLFVEFGSDKNFSMYVAPLMEECLGTKYVRSDENRKRVFSFYKMITDKLMRLNVLTKSYLPTNLKSEMSCIAVSNVKVIFPDGQFAFCHDYSEGILSGKIDESEPTEEERLRYATCIPEEEKCKVCIEYPQCIRLEKCFNNKCTKESIDEWIWTTQNEMIWKFIDSKTAP